MPSCRTWFSVCMLASAVAAQNVTVTATGSMSVASSTSPAGASAPINGSATMGTGFGSVALTTGDPTTLTMAAHGPFGVGAWALSGANVVLSFTSSVPIAGVLRVTLQGSWSSFAPNVVDFDADGTFEFHAASVAPATLDHAVVLGSHPVRVSIQASVVSVVGTSGAALSVAFVPQPTSLQTVLPPCGPDASASLRPPSALSSGRLRVGVGSMNGLAGAFYVGTVPTAPSIVCGQAANVDVAILVTPSTSGVTIDVPLLPALTGVFRLQYVELTPPFQLWWSNGVELTLP